MTATDVPALDPSRPSDRARVEAIHIADVGSAPMRAVDQVRATAGSGLEVTGTPAAPVTIRTTRRSTARSP